MLRRRLVLTLALAIVFTAWGTAGAWHIDGHRRATKLAAKLAARALPQTLPAFFREGAATLAATVSDPDYFKDKTQTQLDDTERPEHFIDVELLRGKPLPATRFEYYRMLDEMHLKPQEVGTLPYAIIEWTQRLTLAFAEIRLAPENKTLQAKCLVYAGNLAHYAQDLCQPLHCTVDFDGRARADNSSPRTGIHEKVDGLLQRLALNDEQALAGLDIKPAPDLMAAMQTQLAQSRALIDKTYALEAKFPSAEDAKDGRPITGDPEAVAFAQERLRAAAAFTATLYLTAWEDSARIKVPDWLGQNPGAPGAPGK